MQLYMTFEFTFPDGLEPVGKSEVDKFSRTTTGLVKDLFKGLTVTHVTSIEAESPDTLNRTMFVRGAMEQVQDYIEEAEHQNGLSYWKEECSTVAKALCDFGIYLQQLFAEET